MIRQYSIKSFEDIYSIGWLLNMWIFRGQANSEWYLSTKAERVSDYLKINVPSDLEWLAVDKFQREAQQYTINSPTLSNRVDWLSFLQHHGGPTRLLDFTKSIYVALYFAIENSYSDATIWCINERKIFENLDDKIKDDLTGRIDYTRSHRVINQRTRHEICDSGLLPVMPAWMSQRQSIQQGVFLYPENLLSLPNKGDGNPEGKRYISFQDNLEAEFTLSIEQFNNPEIYETVQELGDSKLHINCSIIKLLIPNDLEMRIHLLAELHKMNINSRTLFPGLEGLANSYNFSFEGYESKRMFARAFKPQVFTPDKKEENC